MIWLLNYQDAIGAFLARSLQAGGYEYIAMHTTEMPQACAIGQDGSESVIWWQGGRYALSDIQWVYCGYGVSPVQQDVPQDGIQDWHYVTSAWQAWLRYALARVPSTLGVLADYLWIDSWRHLPALAHLAPQFGLQVPAFRYVHGGDYGKGWAYVNDYMITCLSDCTTYQARSVMAVDMPQGHWLHCAWLQNTLYTVVNKEDTWYTAAIPDHVALGLKQLSQHWGLTMCQYLLRQSGDHYYLYGCTPRVDQSFVDHYAAPIWLSLQSELAHAKNSSNTTF